MVTIHLEGGNDDSSLSKLCQETSSLTMMTTMSACDHSEHSNGVEFGTVKVREYNRVAGDHPGVSDPRRGPPLAIGWAFHEAGAISLDSFEESRRFSRSPHILPINGEMRKNILKHGFQVSESECQATMREASRCKKLREKTNRQSKFGDRVEGFMLSVKRKGR